MRSNRCLLWVLLAVFMLWASVLPAAEPEVDLTSTVDLVKVKGGVHYRLSPKDDWEAATVGLKLKVLAQIKTDKDGEAEVSHATGIIRMIGPNETVTAYEIVTDGTPITNVAWVKTNWPDVCRVLKEQKETLVKNAVVKGLRGAYRVEWDKYDLSNLYWKDDKSKMNMPTHFHVRSAIAALEKIRDQAANDDQKSELSYLIAECEFVAGNEAVAKEQFRAIIKAYPNSSWSQKAKARI